MTNYFFCQTVLSRELEHGLFLAPAPLVLAKFLFVKNLYKIGLLYEKLLTSIHKLTLKNLRKICFANL